MDYCLQYGVCIEYRPKNKCEINPEADGCVCDEWENITERIQDGYSYELFSQAIANIGFYEKMTITTSVGNSITNCSIEEYNDCGEYHCELVNLTVCNNYREVPLYKEVYKKGDCTKSHVPVCRTECSQDVFYFFKNKKTNETEIDVVRTYDFGSFLLNKMEAEGSYSYYYDVIGSKECTEVCE